jgi:hypothetical protein
MPPWQKSIQIVSYRLVFAANISIGRLRTKKKALQTRCILLQRFCNALLCSKIKGGLGL